MARATAALNPKRGVVGDVSSVQAVLRSWLSRHGHWHKFFRPGGGGACLVWRRSQSLFTGPTTDMILDSFRRCIIIDRYSRYSHESLFVYCW